MFKARYLGNNGQVDLTPEHVSQVSELGMFEQEAQEDGSLIMGQIADTEKLREKKWLQELKNQRRGKAARSGNMPLEQTYQTSCFRLTR
jgi:hypothetical protein